MVHSTTWGDVANVSSRSAENGMKGTSAMAFDSRPHAPCTTLAVSALAVR